MDRTDLKLAVISALKAHGGRGDEADSEVPSQILPTDQHRMTDEDLPEYNPHARAAILQAVDDQLRSPETPEVKSELRRLVGLGFAKNEAKEMIATILALHLFSVMKGTKPFNYDAYLAELRALPEIDYDRDR